MRISHDSDGSTELDAAKTLGEADRLLQMVKEMRLLRSCEGEGEDRPSEAVSVPDGGSLDSHGLEEITVPESQNTLVDKLNSQGAEKILAPSRITEESVESSGQPSSVTEYHEELRVRVGYESGTTTDERSSLDYTASSSNFTKEMMDFLGIHKSSSPEFLELPSVSSCDLYDSNLEKLRMVRERNLKIQRQLNDMSDERSIGVSRGAQSAPVNAAQPPVTAKDNGHPHSTPIISTPVRLYTEKVKGDGDGKRPMRRKQKYELTKKTLMRNYILKMLATKQEYLAGLSSASSAIEVSSSGMLERLAGKYSSDLNSSSSISPSRSDSPDQAELNVLPGSTSQNSLGADFKYGSSSQSLSIHPPLQFFQHSPKQLHSFLFNTRHHYIGCSSKAPLC